MRCEMRKKISTNGLKINKNVETRQQGILWATGNRGDTAMEELRKSFHHELDEVRLSLARLAASVIEAIPRATNVLLSGDLEGA